MGLLNKKSVYGTKIKLIRYKIYLQRSIGYLAVLNSVMIFYVFSRTVGLSGYLMVAAVLLGFSFMFILGYLDSKYILERETEILHDKFPQIKKLLSGENISN